jgi:hypothetical protein
MILALPNFPLRMILALALSSEGAAIGTSLPVHVRGAIGLATQPKYGLLD